MKYLGEDDLMQMMGLGYPGEVRAGPDGNLYEWVQGVDGLGNPYGFWRFFKRAAQRVRRFARRRLRPFLRRYLPVASQAAAFIPGVGPAVASGIRAATPYLQRAGLVGMDGLGALYQAPDGSLYQVAGYGEDEALEGYGEDDELRGFAEDEELGDYGEDEELTGYGEDDELQGFAEDEELTGYGEDEELGDYGEDEELGDLYGYIKENQMKGLDAFVPDTPPGTRMFTAPTQPPELWKPLW